MTGGHPLETPEILSSARKEIDVVKYWRKRNRETMSQSKASVEVTHRLGALVDLSSRKRNHREWARVTIKTSRKHFGGDQLTAAKLKYDSSNPYGQIIIKHVHFLKATITYLNMF